MIVSLGQSSSVAAQKLLELGLQLTSGKVVRLEHGLAELVLVEALLSTGDGSSRVIGVSEVGSESCTSHPSTASYAGG